VSDETVRVFLVDDHKVVRSGLAAYLATAEIKRRWPDVEVIAVTSFVEDAKIRAALEAGATGYLLKDADADVAAAIRSAQAGEVHLDPAAAKALTAALRAPRSAADTLTPREM
jgi:DNA-binding NarL/FixJ family response regulator